MDVLFDRLAGTAGDIGIITLNRQAALNSLTPMMIASMHTQLREWENDQTIKAVVIRASDGRAFCAGGDIRQCYYAMQASDPKALAFFRDEYALNQYIYHYTKPYIAFLDGITMGGGAGISIHGSHVIGTERLVFAMPETSIGFYPDVGGTYFLSHLPHFAGYYLGLTGAKIHSDDCSAIQLIHHTVTSDALEPLLQALAATTFTANAKESVTNVIATYQHVATAAPLTELLPAIAHCFSQPTVEGILAALDVTTATTMQQKSPLSLKVTLAALQRSTHLSFDACIQQEYRMTRHFIESGEFAEGIRAVIIDKDQQPRWKPATLQEVTPEMVDLFFT